MKKIVGVAVLTLLALAGSASGRLRRMKLWGAILLVALGMVLGGCNAASEETPESNRPAINPTPLKKNGERSYEFDEEDLERAAQAPQSVQEYCAGAVSEAQEEGCLSHVEASEVP